MTNITEIQMNYLKNPRGLTAFPQFSWKLESETKNAMQRSYHLQIMRFIEGEQIVYDSGMVLSCESAHITVEGVMIESACKYQVRVRVVMKDGEESEWSDWDWFISGLIDSKEWRGDFISAETKADNEKFHATLVRGSFYINKPVKEAYAYTTAFGLYKYYLNGEKVGTDEMAPGFTSYHKRLTYQTWEITSYLKAGENVLGAMLGAGWYKGKMGFLEQINNYGTQTAFLAQLVIRYEDGTQELIATDSSFKGSKSPIVFADIYDGEIYDARLEQDGWSQVGFKDKEWYGVALVEQSKEILVTQPGSRVTIVDELVAKRIFTTPQGDRVVDFGQNMTGWIHICGQGKAGDRIVLNCFEVLDAQGNVYTDNLRGAKETITYICKDNATFSYHPSFTFMGFQYARIVEFPGNAKVEHFIGQTVHSSMEETGTFTCSNADLNQLQHNILWGLKGNFLDIPTDCPQRNERVGWTGDAQIFCRTASYLVNSYTFFAKWLQDVAADQTPEGGVPHIVPDLISGKEHSDWLLSQGTHSAAAWADVAVLNPWNLYLTYGDKEILTVQYESMKKWIEFMRTHAVDGIWNYRLQFGDWVALDAEEGSYFGATPNDLTCTAYYAYSTRTFARIAQVLGKEADYLTYQRLYEAIVDVFQKRFFDAEGNLTAQTQTAHIIALYFGLTPDRYKDTIAKALVRLLQKEDGHLVTGFVGTPYFCHALSQNGYLKEAYELLLKEDFPSWLYQVKKGATTVWEHWDGLKPDGTMWSPDMNSFNHYAYGAIGEWLYRVVAGIEVDEKHPGYSQFLIYPHVGGGLTYVAASYESIYGSIKVRWEHEDERVTLRIEIPVNTKAVIRLHEGKAVVEDDGIKFQMRNGELEGVTGSGSYVIVYTQ